jgi:hypothetical protein
MKMAAIQTRPRTHGHAAQCEALTHAKPAILPGVSKNLTMPHQRSSLWPDHLASPWPCRISFNVVTLVLLEYTLYWTIVILCSAAPQCTSVEAGSRLSEHYAQKSYKKQGCIVILKELPHQAFAMRNRRGRVSVTRRARIQGDQSSLLLESAIGQKVA